MNAKTAMNAKNANQLVRVLDEHGIILEDLSKLPKQQVEFSLQKSSKTRNPEAVLRSALERCAKAFGVDPKEAIATFEGMPLASFPIGHYIYELAFDIEYENVEIQQILDSDSLDGGFSEDDKPKKVKEPEFEEEDEEVDLEEEELEEEELEEDEEVDEDAPFIEHKHLRAKLKKHGVMMPSKPTAEDEYALEFDGTRKQFVHAVKDACDDLKLIPTEKENHVYAAQHADGVCGFTFKIVKGNNVASVVFYGTDPKPKTNVKVVTREHEVESVKSKSVSELENYDKNTLVTMRSLLEFQLNAIDYILAKYPKSQK